MMQEGAHDDSPVTSGEAVWFALLLTGGCLHGNHGARWRGSS